MNQSVCEYPIIAAKKILKKINKIFVSTDCDNIKKITKKYITFIFLMIIIIIIIIKLYDDHNNNNHHQYNNDYNTVIIIIIILF